MNQSDIHFIKIALEEAKKASWPFGAVVVKNGKILAKEVAGNSGDMNFDPTLHAEMNAIRSTCKKIGSSDLTGCVLYATCEPCALCFGAAWYANIKEIIYGTSLEDIREINKLWGGDLSFPNDHIAETGIRMQGGVLKNEIMDMYKTHPRIIKLYK